MTKNDKNELNRRKFVTTSTAAVVGAACCFKMGGLKEAIARAAATGKIVFTAENLNRLFAERHRAGTIKALARNIASDITGWTKRECELTPEQEKRLASVTSEDWRKVREVLKFVEETGGTLSIQISDPSGTFKHHASPLTCRTTVRSEKKTTGGTTQTREATVELAT